MRECENRLGRILCLYCIHALKAAALAAMEDAVIRARALEKDRLHHAAAALSAIPWILIDVLAPETVRAMIGIPVADDERPAILTRKIFHALLKFLGHVTSCYASLQRCAITVR